MERILIKVLLWPWHAGQNETWAGLFSTTEKLLFFSLLLFVLAFARLRFIEKKLKTGSWPKFLEQAVRLFTLFLLVFFSGAIANFIPMTLNDSNMPIAPHTPEEVDIYRNDLTSISGRKPLLSDSKWAQILNGSNIINSWPGLLTDYIKIESGVGVIVFGGAGYVSPGDLLLATGAILSWWIALAVCVFALKELLQISRQYIFK